MTKTVEIRIVNASMGARPDYQPPIQGEGRVLLRDVIERLDKAHEDHVPVILLTIDSRGGEAAAAYGLYHALRCYSEAGGKVVAFVSGFAGSTAALYLLAADYVVADEVGAAFAPHAAFGDDLATLDRLNGLQRALLEARTTAPQIKVAQWCSSTHVQLFGAHQAKAWGFVDLVGKRRDAREVAHRLALGHPLVGNRPQGDPEAVRQYGAAIVGRVCPVADDLPRATGHITNLIPTATRVPLSFLAPAILKFGVERLSLLDRIYEKSPYMYERIHDPEMGLGKSIMEMTGRRGEFGKAADEIRRVGMFAIHGITTATATAGWWGAYEHAIAPKERGGLALDESRAVQHADEVVRLTQTSYRGIDRSLIERNQYGRLFTMFYGYLSSQLNLALGAHADYRVARLQGEPRSRVLGTVAYSYGLLIANSLLAEMLTGKGAPDYDNDGEVDAGDWARWTATQALFAIPNTVPFGRAIGEELTGAQSRGMRDVSLLPWLRVAHSASTVLQETRKAASDTAQGDELYKAAIAALETVGWFRGLPVAQLRRTGDFWMDVTPEGIVQSPESEEATAAEAAWGTIYGKKGRGRLSETLFGKE